MFLILFFDHLLLFTALAAQKKYARKIRTHTQKNTCGNTHGNTHRNTHRNAHRNTHRNTLWAVLRAVGLGLGGAGPHGLHAPGDFRAPETSGHQGLPVTRDFRSPWTSGPRAPGDFRSPSRRLGNEERKGCANGVSNMYVDEIGISHPIIG